MFTTASTNGQSKQKRKKKFPKPMMRVSYTRKPDDLTMDEWQIALRKQFAEMKTFTVKNTGNHSVFSDYVVYNPDSGNGYKVSIRSANGKMNFCSCMDFKTNNLGTCKHIEFVLFNLNKKPQSARILKNGFAPHYTSVYLQYSYERNVCIRIGAEKTTEFIELTMAYFDENGILKDEAIHHFEKFLERAHQLHPDFRCYEDALDFVLTKRENQEREQTVDQAVQKNTFFDELIKTTLFDFQKQGVEFALRKGRCLIADDMGLGKTIQAIGAAEGMKNLFGISKVLIVCPTSLKYQWKSEIEKFTENSLHVIEGSIYQRELQYKNDAFYKICSYNVVGRDIENINKNEFDLVILDEAQRIKNWQTATAKNIKKVRTKYAVVLTGTPIENKLEELYSLIQMVDQFKLGALFRFISQHQLTDEITGKIIGYKDLNQIGEFLKDNMIRRHKRDVLKQLPARMDKNLFVSMTDMQLQYHNEAYDIVRKLVNKWIRFKFLNEKDRLMLLINLNRMRMACDSTFILDQTTRHDTKIDELMNILDEVFENGNEKVVVFSQWERMTRIVAMELEVRKIKFENLNGSIPSKDREKLFTNFNKDPECKVFLSTDAGGVGLNLQSASVLINLDLPWNPAVLEQRIGRIYRMGQKRNVQIINLISANTIEHQMLDKLKFKSAMASGVLDNGEDVVFLGKSKFNELMDQVTELTAKEPMPIVQTSEEKINGVATTNGEMGGEAALIETNRHPEFISGQKLFDEDIVEKNKEVNKVPVASNSTEVATEELIQTGLNFFGKLVEALSDKTKTEKLVNSLVQRDEKTGETFLKIPVKNQELVENSLRILGALFGGKK